MKVFELTALITVVTVVLNAKEAISRTIGAVKMQKGVDLEFLIIDGASSDGTLDEIKRSGARWLSEPDRGIYDAMNKAASLAGGKFILFMNAGDEFVEEYSLCRLMSVANERTDIILGNYVVGANSRTIHEVNDGRCTYDQLVAGDLTELWFSGLPCHQATATRTALLREFPFDTSLTIAADHDFLYRMAGRGAQFALANCVVARYDPVGLSSSRPFTCVRQWIHIGEKYSRSGKRVWKFYAPRLIASYLLQMRQESGNIAKLKFAVVNLPDVIAAAIASPREFLTRTRRRIARWGRVC